ncbi:MAG: AMP-binding protein [Candidatus Electryonea clarkiae]|nr:AMP-binding protein [Candidatus Electryonea clarkiae]MDP8286711.1 AMP-binding protein [Candidatus Electryonea clarkiae]
MGSYESHLRDDRGVFPLSELIDKSANDFGDKPVFRTWDGEEYAPLSYTTLRDRVHALARWLLSQGIGKDDNIAVLGENRHEWAASYLAIQMTGAIVVPVDSMLPAPGIRHVLSDSGAKIIFASSRFLEILAEVENIPTLERWICFDKEKIENSLYLEDLIKEGQKLDMAFPKRDLEETAAILYTSGTTGHSKGVMLTNKNIMSNVASASRIFPIGPEDTFLSILPVHHSFEATTGFLLPMYCGCCITFSKSLKRNDILEGISSTGVTMMVGVPLVYEKMHAGILRGARKKGKEKLLKYLFKVVAVGEKVGLDLGKKLFKSMLENAGFGTVKFFISGGGPLDPETGIFFNRLGIRLMQGYGLTETSPVAHATPPWQLNHICVGHLIPGVEHKIINANDQGVGEVCLKGPNIFKGYYKNEEATKEAFTKDGWFKTGDLGIIHKDDFLQITGREKAMLVTAGGKNVYPEEIEFYLNRNEFVAESVVMGIPRAKGMGDDIAALIHPDYEAVDLHFEKIGKKPTSEDIHQLIKGEIKKIQVNLADYKRIKTFRIHQDEFQKTTKRTVKRFLYTGDMVTVNGDSV